MSLLQTILATHKPDFPYPYVKVRFAFHGHEVALLLPLPVGLTLQSPGLDLKGDCLASWHANGKWDIFPDGTPNLDPRFPADAAWPVSPPRGISTPNYPALAIRWSVLVRRRHPVHQPAEKAAREQAVLCGDRR